jgi:competence protein ComEA
MTINYKKWKNFLIILFLVLSGLVVSYLKNINKNFRNFIELNWLFEKNQSEQKSNSPKTQTFYKDELITVKITGCVEKPGIYKVKNGTSLIELVQIAGWKNYANLNNLENVILKDAEEYYIPIRKLKDGEKININNASVEELCRIPMINEKLAKEIFEYRKKYGKFDSIEEIKEVEGIDDKIYNAIKKFLYLGE